MEPGRQDRGDKVVRGRQVQVEGPEGDPVARTGATWWYATDPHHRVTGPQWSPVARTGATGRWDPARVLREVAAMEPGRQDRVDLPRSGMDGSESYSAMEPGRQERVD